MKVGDLIYHVDDWADKKPVVGIILAFTSSFEGHRAKIIFTDKNWPEWWPAKVLRHVEQHR
jgi:hypothetical protein